MRSEIEMVPVMRYDYEAKKAVPTGTEREQLVPGTVVKLKDEQGVSHLALVTAVHGPECINAVYVTKDTTKHDPYGLQVERLCSLQKQSESTALNGRYYEHI